MAQPAGKVRKATADDEDALLWIIVASFKTDPAYTYRYPKMDEYWDEFLHHNRLRIKRFLDNPDITVMVYEAPSNEDPNVNKPVACAVWVPLRPDMQPAPAPATVVEKKEGDDDGKPVVEEVPQRYASPRHVDALQADFSRANQLLIDMHGGVHKQMFLGVIGTHPEYHRRGAGKALMNWGIDKARAESKPVTLFASPVGSHLYRSLGFVPKDTFRTQLEGEEDFIEHTIMELDTSG